jgi:ubiquinone biosynthesis protein UbiJ
MSEAAGASAGGRGGGWPAPPAAPALNHLLRRASWARDRLRPFAGKSVRFDIMPFSTTLEILASGEVADGDGKPDTTFRLTPALALRMAADPQAWREVETSGDLLLAREVLGVAQDLRWDAEEDLSRIFGDIIAHRLTGAGRALARWQRDTAGGLARQAAAYWTDERPLIAARALLEQFSRDIDALRDDAARFEKRLEQLERRR